MRNDTTIVDIYKKADLRKWLIFLLILDCSDNAENCDDWINWNINGRKGCDHPIVKETMCRKSCGQCNQ